MKDHEEEWQELCAQAAVEQDPEKLMDLIRRINTLLDAKDKRSRRNEATTASQGSNRIFQIAYDGALLISRSELLKARGYEVVSVLGNENAKRLLEGSESYALFIVGHNAAKDTREEMVRWLKARFPESKIVALNAPDASLAEADYNFRLNGPEEWLAVVAGVTGQSPTAP